MTLVADFDLARARARDARLRAHVAHFNNAGAALMPPSRCSTPCRPPATRGRRSAATRPRPRPPSRSSTSTTRSPRLLGCDRDEIAIVENATRAWDMAFYALPLRARRPHPDRAGGVRQQRHRLPAGRRAHRRGRRGRRQRRARPALGRRRCATTAATTRGASSSPSPTCRPTAGWSTRPRRSAPLAREAGVPYLLDACQSVGQLPVDVERDRLRHALGHRRKYLRGPRGTGFLYVRRELIERLEPPFLDLHAATGPRRTATRSAPTPAASRTGRRNVRRPRSASGVAVDYALRLGPRRRSRRGSPALAERLRGGCWAHRRA